MQKEQQLQEEEGAGQEPCPGARAVLASALPSHGQPAGSLPGQPSKLPPCSQDTAACSQSLSHLVQIAYFPLCISAEMSGPDTTVLNVKRAKNNVRSLCNSAFNLGSVKARSRKEW